MEILSDAIEKVRFAIDAVEDLEGIHFPHDDARDALLLLKQALQSTLRELESLDGETKPSIVRSYCVQATTNIADTLEALRLIVNSTNIRNAFEVHKSFLDISRQLVGDDARLLLSFEWDYVPFTYPLNVPFLPNYVVIGLPASEAGNALIIPAAGHELGHSIWRKNNYGKTFGAVIQDNIKQIIADRYWREFKKHTHNIINVTSDLDGLIGKGLWQRAYTWALSQAEEVFCDMVGLRVFGTAYLHTFSYLLAPRFGDYRPEVYPSIERRAEFLEAAASKETIDLPNDFVGRFQSQPWPYSEGQFSHLLLRIADATTEAIFDRIHSDASGYCAARGFSPPTEHEWSKVVEAFRAKVPASGARSLATILNGGWSICRDKSLMGSLEGGQRATLTLNELLLKSVEVFEIESLLGDSADDSQTE